MVEQFRKRMGDRSPIWTMIGVATLAAPNMRVEIKVTAVVGRLAEMPIPARMMTRSARVDRIGVG
ncbi:hypothetical protein [Micromonospora endophytica]|nr:hypothetical protein [Micromonospora endophytica]